MMRGTKKTALAGMLTALTVLIMLVGMIDSMDLSAAMLGGLVVLVAMTELGNGYAFGVYAAAGIISVLFVPSAGITFLCFGGIYPILKSYIEKMRIGPLKWLIKIIIFAVMTVLYVKLAVLPTEVTWYLYPFSFAAMLLYDVTLKAFSVFYIRKIRNRFKGL